MATKSFAAAIVGDAASAGYFITNILQASNEYSITGKSLDGTVLLWNDGARQDDRAPAPRRGFCRPSATGVAWAGR